MERIPWRERVFLNFADAGDIFAKSSVWVREQIEAGKLQEQRWPKGSPAVTVASVAALVDEMLAAPRRTDTPQKPREQQGPRLAWDRERQGGDELIETVFR
jgi:hypothetical protein